MKILQKSFSIFKNQTSLLAMIFVLALVMAVNFKTTPWNKDNMVIASDACQYYSYLPAIFIYDDIKLTFLNENPFLLGVNFYPTPSPTGEIGIITTYGVALLYSPFFFAGHGYALLFDYPATGLSSPYKFMIQWSSWVYLLFGLLLMRRLLRKYFTDTVTAIVIVATVLSTNLLWYVTIEAPMSHVYSFFTITAFLFLIDRWIDRPGARDAILIGLLAGLLALIRPTNAVVGILLILWKVDTWQSLKGRLRLLLEKWPLILTMIGMAIIMWLPQLYYWKLISGVWFFNSYPDNNFFWSNPQLFNNLFSWRKGWLIYTPVMAFMLIGIGLLYKVKRPFFWSLLIYYLATWYIMSSWWSWWYGGGLSIRPYVDSYGIFAFGLAGFLSWAFRQGRWMKVGLMIPFVFTLWNGAHNNGRYYHFSIHIDSNTKRSYLDGFFQFGQQEGFIETLEKPDYNLARQGIYRIEGEEADSLGH